MLDMIQNLNSTLQNPNNCFKTPLNPWWIVGFVDGDGHFRNKPDKHGYQRHSFVVSQDKRSVHVLHALVDFFQCGHVHKAGGNMMEYCVSSKHAIQETIIPFFDKYHLQTIKYHQWAPFTGHQDMRNYFDSDYVKPAQNKNITLDWLSGFIDAEGCFYASVCLKKSLKIPKYYTRPKFFLGSSSFNEDVLLQIKDFLGYGSLRKVKNKDFFMFEISALSNLIMLTDSLLPLLKTTKLNNLKFFKEILVIMSLETYCTEEHLELIRKLKAKMNKKND